MPANCQLCGAEVAAPVTCQGCGALFFCSLKHLRLNRGLGHGGEECERMKRQMARREVGTC